MTPIPAPEQVSNLELTRLRARVGVYEQFEARIRAELASPGHVTKAEVRAALADLDAAKAVLSP